MVAATWATSRATSPPGQGSDPASAMCRERDVGGDSSRVSGRLLAGLDVDSHFLPYFERLLLQPTFEVMNSRPFLALAVPFLVLACDKGKRRKPSTDDSAPSHDTGPVSDTEPGCDTGYLDDDGDCVPAACGTGTWGDLELDESTVYVDIAAAEGGDGSEAAPFTSIQEGLDAAGDADGGLVAVAAGSYPETLELWRQHDDVRLAGRCRELVVIDASAGDETSAGIDADLMTSEAEVSGVTVSGSHYAGVLVRSGTMTLRDSAVVGSGLFGVWAYQTGINALALMMEGCEIGGNTGIGVAANGAGTAVALRETTIEGTQPDESAENGHGIEVSDGASLDAEACLVRDNVGLGVLAIESGTSVTLRESAIEDTQPWENGELGYGIQAHSGGSLEAVTCQIRRNVAVGVSAADAGTSVTLRESSIEDTQPNEDGRYGLGAQVTEGASLHAECCEVTGNARMGLAAYHSGSVVTLLDTNIEDTLADEDGYGYGITVQDGASLTAEACSIQGNTGVGLSALERGTSVTLRETAIEGTQPNERIDFGYGISVQDGASLDAEACEVRGNTALGLIANDAGTSVSLRETTIEATEPMENGLGGYGIEVYESASLYAEACVIRGNSGEGVFAQHSGTSVTLRDTSVEDTLPLKSGGHGAGIEIRGGASLDARGCEIRGNTGTGVVASEQGTSAILSDTKIAATMPGEIYTVGLGLVAQLSASVVATDIEASSNEGPGFYAVLEDTYLACSGCVSRDNQFAGAIVADRASLVLVESLIEGTAEQENLGGGVGIYADPRQGGHPSLTITDSTIQDNAIAGVWLTEQGSYSLSRNSIHGGEGWTREGLSKCGDAVYARGGVTAWDGSSGLLLESNEILDGLGAGVFLDDATATLSSNSYVDNAVDLVVQGSDCATAPDGYENEAIGTAQLCPAYDYATCADEFMLYLSLAEPVGGDEAAFMQPGLPGPRALPVPVRSEPRPFSIQPPPLLPPAPRIEPLEGRLKLLGAECVPGEGEGRGGDRGD